jgi:type IV secretory pathway TrbL component
MKTATRIIFASALTLSAVAPTFAHAAYLQNASQIRSTSAPVQHAMHKRAHAVRGVDSMAYAPADVDNRYSRDFGIGSQR